MRGQGVLELVAAHAGLGLNHLRYRVDADDVVHPGQVQDDRAGVGDGAAAHSGAAAAGNHGYACFAGPGQHRGDLFGAGREDHRGGDRQVVAAGPPQQGQRPGVDGPVAQEVGIGRDRAVPEAAGENINGVHGADSNPVPGSSEAVRPYPHS